VIQSFKVQVETTFTCTALGSGTSASNRAYLRNVKISGSVKGLYADQLVNYLTLEGVTFAMESSSYAIHVNNIAGAMNSWAIENSTFNANSFRRSTSRHKQI
jgi:hypothetical protein